MDCCDPNGLNQMFAGTIVSRELQAFRRKGVNRRQQAIISQLEPVTPETSVLDIGCGLGVIGTTLLAKGAGHSTFVDISVAYLKAAREVAAEAVVEQRATFVNHDFATSEDPYAQADVVVLDRVVCCYPNAIPLLEKAARHSRQTLVFTYPHPFWFMPLFQRLCAFGMKLMGREYRFFLHDPEILVRTASRAGHAHVVTRSLGVWQLVKVSKTKLT